MADSESAPSTSRLDPAGSEPATMVVTASPAPGKEHEWEQTLGELIRAAFAFPGYLGTIVLKPPSPLDRSYRIITKFDSPENMRRWQDSEERQTRLVRLHALEASPPEIHHRTGLETWFELPNREGGEPMVPPPRYKMAAMVWIAVYFVVLPLIAVVRPIAARFPYYLGAALTALLSVAVMTWIVMPALTWIFRFWLYPSQRR